MNKKSMLFTLLLGACFQSQAQLMEMAPATGGYSSGPQFYMSGTLDPCTLDNKDVKFRVTSQYSIQHYLVGTCPTIGRYVWKIRCRIFDVTDNIQTAYFSYPDFTYLPELNACTESDVTSSIEAARDYVPDQFSVTSDKKIQVYFTGTVVKGHKYEALFEIENYYHWPNGSLGSKSVQANEWSNVMEAVGYQSVYANTWTHTIIQPSFTNVSRGTIAGNLGGNGEGYLISKDYKVYNVAWSNNQWNIWVLDNNFTKAAPGGITVNPNNGQVYFIGTDGRVYNAVWTNNQWNIWALSNSFTNAAPGAITVNPNNGEVYFIGKDNRVYNALWANNQWNIQPLISSFTNAAPGGISVNPGNGEVYLVGLDNKVYNCVWSNNQWNIWALSNSFTNAAPGGISVNPSNGEVYIVGLDHRLYSCVWANNQWNVWGILPSFTDAAYGAITVHPENGHVYFINNNGVLYNAVWSNNQWNVWPVYPLVATNTYGTLGIMKKVIDNKMYDMVLTTDEQGHLHDYYWLSCLPVGVAKSANPGTTAGAIHHIHSVPADLAVTPNPVENTAMVKYSLQQESTISLSLYDIRGVKVRAYYNNAKQSAGDYSMPLDRENLSAGIYLLVLESNKERQLKKIVIK